MPRFLIEKKISGRLGRAGVIQTPHGSFETPAFVIVGTKANVKSLTPEQVEEAGGTVLLANTYHLYLQPGDALVRDAGGLGAFMHWSGPTMTDSGGFQVYSLGSAYTRGHNKFVTRRELDAFAFQDIPHAKQDQLATIEEDGVRFRSHLDGSEHFFTPEKSIAIQHNLGADIMFAFDECTSPLDSYDYQRESMERTHHWAQRSLQAHQENHEASLRQGLFGIVQGGPYRDLREESARFIGTMDFDGFGIGGSYTKEDMEEMIQWVNPLLPEEKPRHLLGIGEPAQLFLGVEHGTDTFDCVVPTREARNGALYGRHGRFNIHNAKYKNDFSPVDGECTCYGCTNYTRAYLAHLFRAHEVLSFTLATIHNLHFFTTLMKDIRQSILEDRFFEFRDRFIKTYQNH